MALEELVRTYFLALISVFILECTVGEARVIRRFRVGWPRINNFRQVAQQNNNLQRVAGFSNLAIVGNRVVELDAFGRFKQNLFIDRRTGRLFGRLGLDRNTNGQLKEFFREKAKELGKTAVI